MTRTVVVVTRVGARLSLAVSLPPPELTQQHCQLASRVAARALAQVSLPHVWVWITAPERTHQVRTFLEEQGLDKRVILHVQGTPPPSEIPGEHFLTVRLDADDAWVLDAFELLPRDLEAGHALHFSEGWQVDLTARRACALSYDGHWVSPYLVIANEGRDNMLEICEPHMSIGKVRTLITARTLGWVQIVGPWNTFNRFNRFDDGLEINLSFVLSQIGLMPEEVPWLSP